MKLSLVALAFGSLVGCLTPTEAKNAQSGVLTAEQVICVTADLVEVGLAGDATLAHDLSLACGIAQAFEPDVADLISKFQAKRAAIRAARGDRR